MGRKEKRTCILNWQELDLPQRNTSELDKPFTEEEIWTAIEPSLDEKASGPDGFTGMFYKSCWDTIKGEVMNAFHNLHSLSGGNLDSPNRAIIVLLPKKQEANSIKEFRPISLIHSIAKLLSKILALWLSKNLDHLVLYSQSTFIK